MQYRIAVFIISAGLTIAALSSAAHARSYEQRARDITVEIGYEIDKMLEGKAIDHGMLKELRGELERLDGELAVDGQKNNRVQACWEMMNILVKDTARFEGMSDTDRVSYLGWIRITMDAVWQSFKAGQLSDASDITALLPHGGGGMGGKRMEDMPSEGTGQISSQPMASQRWAPFGGAKGSVSADALYSGWRPDASIAMILGPEQIMVQVENGYSASWTLPSGGALGAMLERGGADPAQLVVTLLLADGAKLRYMIGNGATGPVFVAEQ